ncbi:MAG: efflux RND transporter permease subunit [Halioglobus sp.]|nr:efflux RND transporter permease subunit [Halioglobus sp.]
MNSTCGSTRSSRTPSSRFRRPTRERTPLSIRGFITTPLEQEIATAEDIDYLASNSTRGISIINAYVRTGADPDEVLTQVVTKVNKLRNELPREAEDPVLTLTVGEQVGNMYISFISDEVPINRVADYVVREVEPKLSTLPGVLRASSRAAMSSPCVSGWTRSA